MKTVKVEISLTQSEVYLLEELCYEYKINLSSLIRECSLSGFNKNQTVVKLSDLFSFSAILNDVSKSVNQIIKAAEIDNIYPLEISKIITGNKKCNDNFIQEYKSIQGIRKNLEKKIPKKIKRNIKKEIPGEKREKCVKSIWVHMEPKERELIKAKAKEQGIPMTDYLKNNVFKKCSLKRAVVDTCPLEKYNEELKSKSSILAAIAGKSKDSILNQRDLMNVLYLLEDITDIQEQIDKEIQEIDVDKEIQRILSERSEIHGSSKN